jgi:cryptochrome
MMPKTGIHWFRHGLRLHDNPALFSCQDEVERFIPIFIFDGKSAGKYDVFLNDLNIFLSTCGTKFFF